MLARGSALRFLMTRLYDWLHQVEGALVKPKDPREYLSKLRFHRGVAGPAGLRPDVSADAAGEVADPHRRRLQRQSRPGRLGRDPRLARQGPRAVGGEPLTTNNRMELMAAIEALETLKRPMRGRLFTDSQYLRKGITEWIARLAQARLADRRQEAGQEPGPVGAARRGPARHEVEWRWLKGHAGHADNERGDELARDEIRRLRGQ